MKRMMEISFKKMGIGKGFKRSRNLRLLNFDFGTFLGIVGSLQMP